MGSCFAWGQDEMFDEVQIGKNEQIGVHLVIGACLCSNVFEFKCCVKGAFLCFCSTSFAVGGTSFLEVLRRGFSFGKN
jgi:hypothetical protein